VIFNNMYSAEEAWACGNDAVALHTDHQVTGLGLGWVGTQTDMDFFKDLKSEIKDQCEKLGKVESIGVFEDNPDGIIAIQFKEPEAVVACIAVSHSIT
jgi:hypothetical protein